MVRQSLSAHPVRGVADIDAGGVTVLDRQRGELGTFLGRDAGLCGEPRGAAQVSRGAALGGG
jgi:hypothetical protein